jgi:mono/diheme cytochrome c family protein
MAACAAARPVSEPPQLILPEGDVQAGKRAFVTVGCASCHSVEGVDGLPKPTVQPPVPIVFGRRQASRPTNARLVTAIVNPNIHISEAHKGELVRLGDGSRMSDFTRALTVRELVDLVAFLQSTYDASTR